MTFLEACRCVLSRRSPGADYDSRHGMWRDSWPHDTVLGFNDKKDAYANSPGVGVFLDDNVSRTVVLSLTKLGEVSYVGWLPSVEDLVATDWETNIFYELPGS